MVRELKSWAIAHGRSLCISSCASVHRPPSTVTAPLWVRRVVRTLADGSGAREGSTRTTDTARAASVFVVRLCRLSSVFVVCRLSFVVPPTLGFGFFLYFGFWLASAGVSQLMLMLMLRPDHLATVLVPSEKVQGPGIPLGLVGRRRPAGRRIAHGPRSVLGSLGVCRGTVRRESRVGSRESRVKIQELRVGSQESSQVTSPQPQPQSQSQPQSGHPTRANLVHMYDPQDMKKKRDVNERRRRLGSDACIQEVWGSQSVIRHPSSNEHWHLRTSRKFRVYICTYIGLTGSTIIFCFLIPLLILHGDPVCARCRQWVTVTKRRRRG